MSDLLKKFPFTVSGLTDISELEKQYALNTNDWDAAFRFLASVKSGIVTPGRHELTENGAFATVSDIGTVDEKSHTKGYELHRKYIDIQYASGGSEIVRMAPDKSLLTQCISPYDAEGDIEFHKVREEATGILLDGSNCLVAFPSNPHKPGIAPEGRSSTIRKTVVKIPYYVK